MTVHLINIKPDGIENGHADLPFDVNMFKSDSVDEQRPERQMVISENKVRRSIKVDGELIGYVHTDEFALEIVRAKFSKIMRELFDEKDNATFFQVKYEFNQKTDERTCKLYQVVSGYVYNSRTKLSTIQINKLPRLELKRIVA